MLTRLIRSAPKNAALKPSTLKPRFILSDTHEVTPSIAAFITNVKSPSENMIRGRVNNFKIGRMNVFTRPKITPVSRIPHHSPEKVMPGTNLIASIIAIVFMSQVIKMRFIVSKYQSVRASKYRSNSVSECRGFLNFDPLML